MFPSVNALNLVLIRNKLSRSCVFRLQRMREIKEKSNFLRKNYIKYIFVLFKNSGEFRE